jgi:small subunit ribosomal protein S2
MPYVTERWPGGMLTNFPTIRKAVKKMTSIDNMSKDGTFTVLSKREKLQITRERAKLEKNLGSIADLTRLPAALFVVDAQREHIAVKEAKRLGIPVFGIVDTNTDPSKVDYVIPANDDATKSISVIIDVIEKSIQEGLEERKAEKDKEVAAKAKKDIKKEVVEETKGEAEAGETTEPKKEKRATKVRINAPKGDFKKRTQPKHSKEEPQAEVKEEKKVE